MPATPPVNFVDLVLYHDTDDPAIVSDLLNVRASHSRVKGEISFDMPVPQSCWFLDFEGAGRGFERAIGDLVDVVQGHLSELLDLQSRGWEAKVSILIEPRIGYTGGLFTAEQMRVLGEAGIHVDLWTFPFPAVSARPAP